MAFRIWFVDGWITEQPEHDETFDPRKGEALGRGVKVANVATLAEAKTFLDRVSPDACAALHGFEGCLIVTDCNGLRHDETAEFRLLVEGTVEDMLAMMH